MRVLVTGCYGQVGHCLTEQLKDKPDTEVLALDRESLDITDSEAIQKTVREFKPTVIINAAAHTAVDKAEEEVELSYKINRDGPKFLAEAAEELDAAILHISTDYVFSGEKEDQYQEQDSTAPQGVYGQSKLAGEEAVAQACAKHIILRTAWVFGEHGNNFVKTMLRLGKDRNALSIVGDQFGGPTYSRDIAFALIEIATQIEKGVSVEYGVYHFSGLPHTNWFEFAQAIFEQAEEKGVLKTVPKLSSITTAEYPTPAKRPVNSKLATDKITQAFNIKASDWQAALLNIENYVQ